MLSNAFNLVTLIISLGLLLSGFCMGFLFRTARNYKFKKRILELENEMVQNHAEILSLVQNRKEASNIYSSNATVITLNSNSNRLQENKNIGNAK
jgi:hypothetical protein